MKKGLILTIILLSVWVLGFSQQTEWKVNNMATWIDAVNGIRSGGNDKEYTITLNGNLSVPSSDDNLFGSGTGIVITIEGNGTISLTGIGNMLFIGNKQTVIVRNLKLQGRSGNNSRLVVVVDGGIFRMEGNASITGNTANEYNFWHSENSGGGVYVNNGTFTMQDSASVTGNSMAGFEEGGGGIYIENGTFTMQDNASVVGNTSTYRGGGIYIENGTFTMRDNASVSRNTTTDKSGFSDRDGGGGVFVSNGTFTMQGGTVSGNITSTNGGGVYNSGTFTMQGGTVSRNIANGDEYEGDGGGGVSNGGTFNMQGGTVSGNNAIHGGGVRVSGTFTMQNSASVSYNSAIYYGGGVCVIGGTFTMQDNASVSSNVVNGNIYEGDGGGVYIFYRGTFTMQDSTSVSGNFARFNGGGIYIGKEDRSTGNFTIRDNAYVSGNTANSNGGGVFISNSGTFTKTGGNIYGYDALGDLKNNAKKGCAIFNEGNGNWRSISVGPTMNLNSYGFWLNDDKVIEFPSAFTGTWKRDNFNNMLTITANTVKSSSQNYAWNISDISGDSHKLIADNTAKSTLTLTVKFVNGNIVISGDSGNGQDNWNGTWKKQ